MPAVPLLVLLCVFAIPLVSSQGPLSYAPSPGPEPSFVGGPGPMIQPGMRNVGPGMPPLSAFGVTIPLPPPSVMRNSGPGMSSSTMRNSGPVMSSSAMRNTGPVMTRNAMRNTGPVMTRNAMRNTGPVMPLSAMRNTGPVMTRNAMRNTGPVMSSNAMRNTGPIMTRNAMRNTGPVRRNHNRRGPSRNSGPRFATGVLNTVSRPPTGPTANGGFNLGVTEDGQEGYYGPMGGSEAFPYLGGAGKDEPYSDGGFRAGVADGYGAGSYMAFLEKQRLGINDPFPHLVGPSYETVWSQYTSSISGRGPSSSTAMSTANGHRMVQPGMPLVGPGLMVPSPSMMTPSAVRIVPLGGFPPRFP